VHTLHASGLNAYLRWEFASQTATNVPAGEDIRVVDLDRHLALAADEHVWIFDDLVRPAVRSRSRGSTLNRRPAGIYSSCRHRAVEQQRRARLAWLAAGRVVQGCHHHQQVVALGAVNADRMVGVLVDGVAALVQRAQPLLGAHPSHCPRRSHSAVAAASSK
jgi:hypothetical protein